MGYPTILMTSYSQAGQDLFAFAMTEGKTDGSYLDIGCNDAQFHSNTYALEQLGWTGLLVDIVGGCESRKGAFVKRDASQPDEALLFQYSQLPDVVDYLSIDVDDSLNLVIKAIPFSTHTFRVITVEHDKYVRGALGQITESLLLASLGYQLVCRDVKVVPPGIASAEPFEDWWVFPQLINPELILKYQCEGQLWSDILKR